MIPVVCLYMARPLASGPRWLRFACMALLVGVVSIGANKLRQYWSLENTAASQQVRLARLVQEHSEPDDLIIVANGDGSWNPVMLYLSHRKGWADHPRRMPTDQLAFRVRHGARWLIGEHAHLGRPKDSEWLKRQLETWRVVHDDGEIFILELAPAP